MSPTVAVVGSLNLDVVVTVPRMPDAGETVFGTSVTRNAGGKGLNQAVAAARLGSSVAMIGSLGSDEASTFLHGVLGQEGIDATHVQAGKTLSGVAFIEVDDAGANRIVVVPGANAAVSADQVSDALSALSGVGVVLTQCEIPLPAVAAAMATGRALKATTILNPAPALSLTDSLLANVDVLVPNEHEASLLTGHSCDDEASALAAARALRARGVTYAVITRGAHGAVWVGPDGEGTCDPYTVTAIDTVAAGDAFAGGLATALAEGRDFVAALRWASASGALATTTAGAVPSLPHRPEVESLVKSSPA